jgi:hypothetical protein
MKEVRKQVIDKKSMLTYSLSWSFYSSDVVFPRPSSSLSAKVSLLVQIVLIVCQSSIWLRNSMIYSNVIETIHRFVS